MTNNPQTVDDKLKLDIILSNAMFGKDVPIEYTKKLEAEGSLPRFVEAKEQLHRLMLDVVGENSFKLNRYGKSTAATQVDDMVANSTRAEIRQRIEEIFR